MQNFFVPVNALDAGIVLSSTLLLPSYNAVLNVVSGYFLLALCKFDALIVNPAPGSGSEDVDGVTSAEGPFDLFPELGQGMQAAFEKFLFLGDDRNIERVFVAGNRVL